MTGDAPAPRVFLVSPARTDGQRAGYVSNPRPPFPWPAPCASVAPARRGVHLPERPLFPGQVALRARVRASAPRRWPGSR